VRQLRADQPVSPPQMPGHDDGVVCPVGLTVQVRDPKQSKGRISVAHPARRSTPASLQIANQAPAQRLLRSAIARAIVEKHHGRLTSKVDVVRAQSSVFPSLARNRSNLTALLSGKLKAGIGTGAGGVICCWMLSSRSSIWSMSRSQLRRDRSRPFFTYSCMRAFTFWTSQIGLGRQVRRNCL